MTLTHTNQEHKYLRKVYRNITLLGIILHTTYALLFAVLRYNIPFLYNLMDILFYITLMLIVNKLANYTFVVTAIHFETIVFCILHTFFFGWSPAFYIYLIAMASLVYFCPFRATYIPYVFSILHITVFFLLYGYSISSSLHITLDSNLIHFFFICNTLSAFIIILYVAYVSKASASVGRKELLEKNENLQLLTNYDQMTGLYNKACMRNRYEYYQNEENVLAIGDIDDFKIINDTYGHICGDIILKELAEQMRTKLDPNIFLCRWGGEEFVFIFNGRSLKEAMQEVNEFCCWIKHYEFHYQDVCIHITMTFGLSLRADEQTLESWIECADQLLYEGKHNGKDVVLIKS